MADTPKPVKPENKHLRQNVLIIVLCLAFFAAGISVPLIFRKGTSADSDSPLGKLESVYEILQDKWYYAPTDEDLDTRLVEQAIAGMTSLEEDPHTNYFSLEQAQQFSQSLAGSNVGIGISFYPGDQGQMVVKSVFINSTADQAGIVPGDQIIKVGDKLASGTSTEDLVSYIKSNENRPVDLDVIHADGSEEIVSVTPAVYDTTVSVQTIDGKGYVILNSFSEQSAKVFAQALKKLQDQGVHELILDLRNNTGGYLSSALDIASSLLPQDTVVFQEKTRDGNVTSFTTRNIYAQIPFDKIVVLQNGGTASASEVLIGALKDNLPADDVILIGSKTYGKGTEQTSIPFEDGTSLKYTIAEWLTPNGTSINKTGFEPDIAVEDRAINLARYADMAEDEFITPDSVHTNAKAAQIFLDYLGYPVDRMDEYFSSASSESLRQFQTDHGLESTGIIDKPTFDALVNAVSLQLNTNSFEEDDDLQAALNYLGGSGQDTTRIEESASVSEQTGE